MTDFSAWDRRHYRETGRFVVNSTAHNRRIAFEQWCVAERLPMLFMIRTRSTTTVTFGVGTSDFRFTAGQWREVQALYRWPVPGTRDHRQQAAIHPDHLRIPGLAFEDARALVDWIWRCVQGQEDRPLAPPNAPGWLLRARTPSKVVSLTQWKARHPGAVQRARAPTPPPSPRPFPSPFDDAS